MWDIRLVRILLKSCGEQAHPQLGVGVASMYIGAHAGDSQGTAGSCDIEDDFIWDVVSPSLGVAHVHKFQKVRVSELIGTEHSIHHPLQFCLLCVWLKVDSPIHSRGRGSGHVQKVHSRVSWGVMGLVTVHRDSIGDAYTLI